MNQRIQQLAEQAGLYDETTPEEVPEFTACFEKFAELIVQECIKELETTQVCDSYTGKKIDCEYNDALVDGIANIKENFGVNDE